MSYAMSPAVVAADARAEARAEFLRKTYGHLAGAVLAFVALEWLLLNLVPGELILRMVTGMGWIAVLVAFMLVGWLAERWARSQTSLGMQYAGLVLYVAAEAAIFLPLLYVAAFHSSPKVIPAAGLMTLGLFGGLTLTVFVTGIDFSFLRSALCVGGFVALGFIIASILLGFSLGLLFCFAMVVLASGYIVYYTSNVLHHYRTDAHVAAALALFAAVALLFWYVLRIFLSSRD